MILGNVKIEREPLMYGIASILSDKTGKNIFCNKEMYRQINDKNVYSYECHINAKYNFVEDDRNIISITSKHYSIKNNYFDNQVVKNNIDRYISLNEAKNILIALSDVYKIDITPVLTEIIESRDFLNKVNEDRINEIVHNNLNNKVLLRK